MPSMSFMPQLRDFLRSHGLIYTVRKYRMSEADVKVEGVGTCHRKPCGTIDKESDLIPFVELSGFQTTQDWWNKIEHFIPNSSDAKYLYKVTIITRSERDLRRQ